MAPFPSFDHFWSLPAQSDEWAGLICKHGIVLFPRKARLFYMRKMVHSDLVSSLKKSCKRRRFLSDMRSQDPGSQSCQDRFRPVLSNSGGASLHPLTRWPAGHSRAPLPPESGNIETRRLPTGGPSKWSLVHPVSCGVEHVHRMVHMRWPVQCPGGPPIKVAEGSKSAFDGISGMRILYWF